ncbi:MAG: hypothetical protein V1912_07405 [bacterium]
MPAKRTSRTPETATTTRPDRVAVSVYGGISIVGAAVFWLITTFTGSYPAVARYGGAAWIFLLLMIVLMPVVIPRVRAWARR